MANYPKELTDLLEQYLTDGVMTAKERGVLLRKAEAMNVDKDEFDLYIDAEIQKIDQKADAIKRQSKGKVCPFCEASIPMLADKCPECGGNITPSATKELEEIIEKLEDALVNFKSGNDIEKSKAEVERYVRKAKLYYENNNKVKKLLEEVESEKLKADSLAKKNARKKVIFNILTYNKGLTIGIGSIGVLLILWLGLTLKSYFTPADLTTDKKACKEAITEALKAGNPERAATLYRNFGDGKKGKKVLGKGDEIAFAFLEKGAPEKALEFLGKGHYLYDADRPIYPAIEKALIDQEKYDEAIEVWERSGSYASQNYRSLCKCIDKMRGTKSSIEIKQFINGNLTLFYEQDQERYKTQLYEYAGL